MVGTDNELSQLKDLHGNSPDIGTTILFARHCTFYTGVVTGYKDGPIVKVKNGVNTTWTNTLDYHEFKNAIIIKKNIEWLFKRKYTCQYNK